MPWQSYRRGSHDHFDLMGGGEGGGSLHLVWKGYCISKAANKDLSGWDRLRFCMLHTLSTIVVSRRITIYRVIRVNWHHGEGHGWKQHPYESSVCSITYANNADSWAEMTLAPCFPSPVQMAIKRRKCPFFLWRRYLELLQMSFFFFCFWPKLALQWLLGFILTIFHAEGNKFFGICIKPGHQYL